MLTLLFDGIAYGMLLFVLAVGLAVTLGLMNFINLAHGAFAMAGGYITVLAMNRLGVPFLVCLPLAFLGAALLAAGAFRHRVGRHRQVPALHHRGVCGAHARAAMGAVAHPIRQPAARVGRRPASRRRARPERVRDEGMSAIIVEQNPRMILPITQHAVVLDRGTVVHQGPSDALLADRERLDQWLGVHAAGDAPVRRPALA
jgi:branched-subunit amino acid transport system permease